MESNLKPIKKPYLSDIEIVVISTKELEARLVDDLAAPKFKDDRTPTSFYDKQRYVEYLFSAEDIEKFKYISNVRNILVHKVDENRLNDRKKFEKTVADLNAAINVAKIELQNSQIVATTTTTATTQSKPKPQSKTGCFIATAVYGDHDHYKVKILRNYRDEKLLTSYFGQLFVKGYYKISPPIALILQNNQNTAKFVGKMLDKIVHNISKRN